MLPIHRQIEQWLRHQIETGALAPGDALPARKELGELLGGVNHLTIRQAIGSLVRDGLLFSVQGRGTFVTEKKPKQLRIGLVLPNIDDEITREIARGVQEAFGETGKSPGSSDVGLVLFDSRHSEEKERQNIGHLQDLPLDGAIIFPVFDGDTAERLVRLKADGFPVVLVDCQIPGIEFDSVVVDNYAGSYEITKHLLKQGRNRIAWLGRRKGYSSSAERYEGYRDAIADFGRPLDRSLTFEIPTLAPMDPYEAAVAKIIKGLSDENMPDAIVCNNDIVALSCISALVANGIKVPEDIAVVGFDDIKEARSSVPPLTTVRQPMNELGRKAAELILSRVAKASRKSQTIKLPVSVVIRKSS